MFIIYIIISEQIYYILECFMFACKNTNSFRILQTMINIFANYGFFILCFPFFFVSLPA